MDISPKIGNFCPSLCLHCGLFNHILSLLGISSEPIGKGKSFNSLTGSSHIFRMTSQGPSYNKYIKYMQNI